MEVYIGLSLFSEGLLTTDMRGAVGVPFKEYTEITSRNSQKPSGKLSGILRGCC